MADEQGYTLTKEAVQRTAKAVRMLLGNGGSSSDPTLGEIGPEVLVKIVSPTDIGEGKWEYDLKIVKKGDKYTADDLEETEIKGYNWCEFITDSTAQSSAVPTGAVLPATLLSDTTGKPEYWFIFGGSNKQKGQYAGMVNMQTSQNDDPIYTFPFAHAML